MGCGKIILDGLRWEGNRLNGMGQSVMGWNGRLGSELNWIKWLWVERGKIEWDIAR